MYLHGTARDTQHRKMSKSLGNGIDPLDVVKLYGADALRWTLIAGMGMGADVILDPNDLDKSFATGRNFGTKLWNIGRFLLDRVGDGAGEVASTIWIAASLTRADQWILARLDAAIAECDRALGPLWPTTPHDSPDARVWRENERFAGLRLNEYAESARRFVWNELADWYLESVKAPSRRAGRRSRGRARGARARVRQALRLLHPVVPFVTESLWQRLPGHADGEFLATRSVADAARERSVDGGAASSSWSAKRCSRCGRSAPTTTWRRARSIDVLVRSGAAIERLRGVFESEAATIGRLTRVDGAASSTRRRPARRRTR